jgi:hypothetical protein
MRTLISAAILATICFAKLGAAAPPEQNGLIRIPVTPRCKGMFAPPPFANEDGTEEKQPPLPDYEWWDPARAKPMAYKDPRSAVSFYVESDGRHIAAIDPDGKLLWVRNPFEEAGLCPYRNARPSISSIAAIVTTSAMASWIRLRGANPSHDFLEIKFDSSQFGVIDETTGDFLPSGQN